MTSFLDPRIRMRDALREIIDETPVGWERPSLFVLRNRLLDRTGSDARPLAELLLEALRRGWRDRLPSGSLDTPRFDSLVSPFVLQWSAERFVQPEMARWAVESWAYALRRIDEQQLRIAPPPKRESMAAMAARLIAQATATGGQTAQAARALTATPAGGAPRVGATRTPAASPARPLQGRNTARTTTTSPARYAAPYTPRSRAMVPSVPSVPMWIPRAMFGILVAMSLAVVVRVGIANARGDSAADAAANPVATPVTMTTDSAGMPTITDSTAGAPPLVSTADVPGAPILAGAGSPPTAGGERGPATPPAAPNATPGAGQMVSPSLTGGIAIVAPERPGVPSITRGMLSAGADTARMLFVQPARRAAGETRRVATASSATPITFDELHLADGTILRGRVEVVRAGTVIFRDMKSGLRVEYRKDDIDEVITEFGTTVRFRAEAAARTARGGSAASGKRGKRGSTARAPESGVRSKGVGGNYRIRYAAASAVGSPECAQVWTRAPNAEDVAEVRHRPGDDTLKVAFRGGDVFPSNVDPDGYFASTFRIVPDQARTMTALTTRLNGRFTADGGLTFTVNIVFYRRLRTGEVTCNVAVKAEGTRER